MPQQVRHGLDVDAGAKQPTFKVDLPLRMVPFVELEFSFWESGLLGRQRSRGRRWIARALCLG
jgi:hypothetical protein